MVSQKQDVERIAMSLAGNQTIKLHEIERKHRIFYFTLIQSP